MAEPQIPIASAVILPEELSSSSNSNPAKRRYSESIEDTSKRPRLADANEADNEKAVRSTSGEEIARQDRRATGRQEERKRGQRLFGNLLGTLSQSSPSVAQKRRADIEKKQQEKLKLQVSAHNEKRKEDLGQLRESRKKEQVKYEEQSMRIRHSNMLAIAHSLQTKARPVLYYKPWELRPAEKTIIRDQIRDAEDDIDRELDEFEQKRQRQRSRSESVESQSHPAVENLNGNSTVPIESTTENGTSDHAKEDHSSEVHTKDGPDVSNQAPHKEPTPVPKDEDDAGEVILEGDEDTVIY